MNAEEGPDLDRRRVRVKEIAALARAQTDRVFRAADEDSELSKRVIELERALPGYEFWGELQRGGQGVVFDAIHKSTKRRVAIKVLKQGPFASAADRGRFEREVQILAALKHPGIVSIHDSGMAAGAFYYVMDYVSGSSLDNHVDSVGRKISLIVELFATICSAVNAAHLLGVVHRDLKPNNIRVDESGAPRLLDFGLAKATALSANQIADVAEITVSGQFVGSLPWASPEQARGEEGSLDARSDVYSLGVILYQMLTGDFPYSVVGSMAHTLQSIMTYAPQLPRRLRPDIDRDLQTIVLKCLSKEPERRYDTAGELGRDLERWLHGEPIKARGDNAFYVVTKTLSRYRGRVLAGLAFVLVIFVAAVALLVLYTQQSNLLVQVRDSADEARRAALKSEQLSQFTRDMLSGIDPATAGNLDKRLMRLLLDRASHRSMIELEGEPDVRAAIDDIIGRTYDAIAEYPPAKLHLDRAYASRRERLGDLHRDTLQSLCSLGALHKHAGRYDEAAKVLGVARTHLTQAFGPEDPLTLTAMSEEAEVFEEQGRFEESESLCRVVLSSREKGLGPKHADTLTSLNNLANLLREQGRRKEAEGLYLDVVKRENELLGDEHPHTLSSKNNLALIYQEQGRLEESESLLRVVVDGKTRVLGEDHSSTINSVANLAETCRTQGKKDEAAELFTRVLSLQRRVLGDSHPDVGLTIFSLAGLAFERGDLARAEELWRESLVIYENALPVGHGKIAMAQIGLGACLMRSRSFEEAEELLLAGYEGIQALSNPMAAWERMAIESLLSLYVTWGSADPESWKAEQADHWRDRLRDDENALRKK